MEDRFPGPGRQTSLKGRARECALLDGLAGAIRHGESRSVVLRGEAEIGKSALLEYLIESASDLTVVRAVGVESEMELAYASLHQLCAPLLDRLERLPAPQRQAVETVFGLSSGTAPDRFLVGLGVLSLVSEVAEERPLLCVIDDAQWLDQASALTLAFVARRLLADPVGLVFAAREPGEELRHVPDLEVRGLLNGDARALLGSTMRFALDERVRDRILAETRGNPLALLELPRWLTPTQLAGGFGMPDAPDLSKRIEESYLRRLDTLPEVLGERVVEALKRGVPIGVGNAGERLGVAERRLLGLGVKLGLPPRRQGVDLGGRFATWTSSAISVPFGAHRFPARVFSRLQPWSSGTTSVLTGDPRARRADEPSRLDGAIGTIPVRS